MRSHTTSRSGLRLLLWKSYRTYKHTQADTHTQRAQKDRQLDQKRKKKNSSERGRRDRCDPGLSQQMQGYFFIKAKWRTSNMEAWTFVIFFFQGNQRRKRLGGRCDIYENNRGNRRETNKKVGRLVQKSTEMKEQTQNVFKGLALTLLFWMSLRMCSKQLLFRKIAWRTGLSEHCRISGIAAKSDNNRVDSSYLSHTGTIDSCPSYRLREINKKGAICTQAELRLSECALT